MREARRQGVTLILEPGSRMPTTEPRATLPLAAKLVSRGPILLIPLVCSWFL
jgi:hypothetical protein